MAMYLSALLRAFCVVFALAMLHACGGGQPEADVEQRDAAAQPIEVQLASSSEDIHSDEKEAQLLAIGYRRIDTYQLNNIWYWVVEPTSSNEPVNRERLLGLGWIAQVTSPPNLLINRSIYDSDSTRNSKSTSLANKARTKATLKYRVFPNPTEGNNLCFEARTIPPEFNSHQEAYQDCVRRIAAQSPDGLVSLGELTAMPGNTVDGQPSRMSAPARFRVSTSDTTWRPLGFDQITGFSRAICPADSTLIEETNSIANGRTNTTYWCDGPSDEDPPETEPETPPETGQEGKSTEEQAGMCTPNPIIPASGEKVFHQTDVTDQAPHPLTFERTYRTQWQIAPQARMGAMWGHNHSANLRQDPADGSGNTLILQLPDGTQRRFVRTSSTAAWTNASHSDRLAAATTAAGAPAWRYTRTADDSQWLFTQPAASTIGLLQTQRQREGWTYTYTYNEAGQLTQVRNQFNRTLTLAYHATTGLLASATGPDNQTTSYTWDASARLTRVTHPGGAYRGYHYEDSRFPQHITGITDENNRRYQTVSYDALGRATVSTLAGNADRYAVSYPSSTAGFNTAATITDPIGTARTFGYRQTNGHTDVTSGSNLPGCKGEPPIALRTQSAQGLLDSETDFRGNVTRYTWDTTRQLMRTITRAAGRPEQQLTSIDWHPTLAVPTLITEPLQTTRHDYDSAGRLLRTTVTHTGGASSGKVQTTQFSYTASGLLATRTEPNGAVTTFANHNTAGLPQTITNALGHATTVVYDTAGRPTQITQPDGLVRTLAYAPRGWLLSSSEAAGGVTMTTTFTYTPSGQVATVTHPNGHVITYQHDNAQRVTGWSDNRGQSASYTLDGLGNITAEQIRNNGGATALQIGRSVNAINRLASQTVGSNIGTTYGYDANGRLQSIRDAANFTTQLSLDALARTTQITNALGRVAAYGYDGQGSLTSARDFKGVTTAYSPDAQGLPTGENSPDSGSRGSTFDALNLPASVVDAMGRSTAITRDLLGRPTRITHSQSGQPTLVTELRYDLSGTTCNASGHANASRGRLCEITTRSGTAEQTTTRYQWDAFGRLTQQEQLISSALASHHQSLSTRYTHVASGGGQGQLATITYPSGAVLTLQYSASGQLSGLLWNGQPLLQNITWNALGQPLSWTWAFADASSATSVSASRSYDSAGLLRSSEFATFTPNNLGQFTAISQGLYQRNASGAWVAESVPHTAAYDALGRLTSFSAAGSSVELKRALTYAWDDNGNRTLQTFSEDGSLRSSSASVIDSASNRLLSLSTSPQALNAAGEHTQLGNLGLAYDSAARLSQTIHAEPVVSGGGVRKPSMPFAPASHFYNGLNQRVLRENPQGQTVYVYGSHGHNVLGEYQPPNTSSIRWSNGLSTEHVWLPTASGPMPVAAVINGEHFAVHTDHLNTPRRLTDRNGAPRWQWAYSGFGEIGPQSLTTATLSEVRLNLRYPGQIDDANGLFYNWHRFYQPTTGRYTKADPIGLQGGWNRFAYVGGNPLGAVDPEGLQTTVDAAIRNALGKGDIAELKTLLEAANPEQTVLIRNGIEKFGSRATEWIAKNCKGSINREFPGQFKDKTLKEILDQSKAGDSTAKKAWKLLNDNRFQK